MDSSWPRYVSHGDSENLFVITSPCKLEVLVPFLVLIMEIQRLNVLFRRRKTGSWWVWRSNLSITLRLSVLISDQKKENLMENIFLGICIWSIIKSIPQVAAEMSVRLLHTKNQPCSFSWTVPTALANIKM